MKPRRHIEIGKATSPVSRATIAAALQAEFGPKAVKFGALHAYHPARTLLPEILGWAPGILIKMGWEIQLCSTDTITAIFAGVKDEHEQEGLSEAA